MSKRALVISGGGSKGAFAVGVIEWMLLNLKDSTGNNINFQLVAGTSTGSLIAPAIALHTLGEPGIIGQLINIYTTTTTQQVLTINGPIDILTHDSLYGTDPLQQLIRNFYTEDRYNKLQASNEVQVIITTVNMTTGYTEFFYVGKPITNPPAGKVINRIANYEQFVTAVLGSASEPVMMPLVTIPGYSGQFTDGGVTNIIPLSVAIDFGTEELYGISLSIAGRALWDSPNPTTPGVLMRLLDVLLDEVLENNIAEAERRKPGLLKALIRPVEDIEKKIGLSALSFDPAKMMDSYNYGRETAKEYFRTHNVTII